MSVSGAQAAVLIVGMLCATIVLVVSIIAIAFRVTEKDKKIDTKDWTFSKVE